MLDYETKTKLLQLRFLILRAAQKDSLQWWEDESLTSAGDYIAERLFLMDPDESARAIAMEAGKTRYRMAFGENNNWLHLFKLDLTGQVEFELRDIRLSEIDMPRDPIPSYDQFQEHLLALTGKPAAYQVVGLAGENRLQIKIKNFSAQTPIMDLAEALAWACMESSKGQLSFPFVTMTA